MLVICEGVDGSGKSTLIHDLLEELDSKADVLHRSQPKRHPLAEYECDLDSYVAGDGRHVLCDRWSWGEQIYGPLYRDGSRLGAAGWVHVELFLKRRGALTLFLDPPQAIVQKRIEARGEDFLQKHDIRRVMNGYRAVSQQTLTEQRRFHSDITGTDIIGAKLLASMLEANAAQVRDNGSLIGSPQPDFLLLGERRGPRNPSRHLAAFVPYPSTSGRFLLESLPTELLPRIAIANALEEDLPLLWKQLGKPRVLALGRNASDACTAADVIHFRMPHPQWARRFHHGLQRDYGATIEHSLTQWEDCSSWPN